MRRRSALSLAVAAVTLLGLVVGSVCADSCAYVTSDFTCSQANAYSVMAASGCKCFSCTEHDGSGNYQCKDAPECGASYTVGTSDTRVEERPVWSTGAYVAIGAVFVAASIVLYGFLWAIARCQAARTYVAEKPSDSTGHTQSFWSRGYKFAYSKLFGSLLAADGKHTRRLAEYWVTECQLLDCFWCCTRHDRPRRGLSLRLMRLASSLLVTASISFFFGTLEFDTTTCSTYATIHLCSSTSPSSAFHASPTLAHSLADGITASTSSTTCTSTTTITGGSTVSSTTATAGNRGGSMSTTTTSGNGGGDKTTTTPSGGGGGSSPTSTPSNTVSSTSSSVVNSVVTSNSCSAMPPIIDSLSKASSIVALCVTQCVKFVGSYAQNLGKPGSTLDWGAHLLWFLVAVAAIPVSAALSTKLLSQDVYAYKSEKLRMRLIVSVTLSAWLQVQVTDIFKVPVIYLVKKFGKVMLPSPPDGAQAVQPRARELDCLGGQHKHASSREDDDEDGDPQPAKVNALAPPRYSK